MLSLPNPDVSKSVLSEIGPQALSKRLVLETSTVTPQHIKDIEAVVYEVAMCEGLDKQDYAAVSKLWERWLGVSFAAK